MRYFYIFNNLELCLVRWEAYSIDAHHLIQMHYKRRDEIVRDIARVDMSYHRLSRHIMILAWEPWGCVFGLYTRILLEARQHASYGFGLGGLLLFSAVKLITQVEHVPTAHSRTERVAWYYVWHTNTLDLRNKTICGHINFCIKPRSGI